ncbi:glycosyltransferase [Microbacterium sp. A93]|uniref:glycosyltransferase n=1 Tax=unclassified Microbacterium TaxID=2609290 RepID=UPI003F434A3A
MSAPLVVVSAGTYHLPFDRLSEWVQSWLQRTEGVRLVMQHGPSVAVVGAENIEILPYTELLDLCGQATAVVLQGGAGGVMDMRALGIIPIVVPRVPGDGEVVDDHQLVFSAEMESLGIIRRALTSEDLAALLDRALASADTDEKPSEISTPGADVVRALLEQPIRPARWYAFVPRLVRSGSAIVASKLRR